MPYTYLIYCLFNKESDFDVYVLSDNLTRIFKIIKVSIASVSHLGHIIALAAEWDLRSLIVVLSNIKFNKISLQCYMHKPTHLCAH